MIDVSKYKKVAECRSGKLNWFSMPNPCAVYILSIGTDFYIGSSKHVYKRIMKHRSLLERGFSARKLQQAYNKEKAFDVYIVKEVKREELLENELYLTELLSPTLNSDRAEITFRRAKNNTQQNGIAYRNYSEFRNAYYLSICQLAEVLGVKCGELFDDYQAESNDSRIICPKCGYEMTIKIE